MNVELIENLEVPNNIDTSSPLYESINFQDFPQSIPSLPSDFPGIEITNLESALQRCGTDYSCAKSVYRHENQLAQVEPESEHEVKEIEPLDGKLKFPTDDDSWTDPTKDS